MAASEYRHVARNVCGNVRAIERDDAARPGRLSRVDQIVRASEQVIEVAREPRIGAVLARGREVRSGLTIQ